MKTKGQVETEFRTELEELLKKWNATIETEDHYQGYAECGQDIRMTVTIPAIYNSEVETVQEWSEIDLGQSFGD